MPPRLFSAFLLGSLLWNPLAWAQTDPALPAQPPVVALSPADEAKTFQLPPGYRLELVLSEPEIKEPTMCAFDGDGRMFVLEMRSYMQEIDGKDEFAPVSRVSLHWSSRHDGVLDQHTVFADNLILPRILLPLDGGRAIIGETNTLDMYLYTDTDGDGVADKKEKWFEGGARGGNLEHQPNGLLWAIDNGLYSTYNPFRLRWTANGPVREPTAANAGQWGLAQDDHGKIFFMDGGGEKGPRSFQAPVAYGAFNPPAAVSAGFEEVFPLVGMADVQGGPPRFRPADKTLNHFTATCGNEIYRGDRLPAELKGNLFFCEPVGRLVRRAVVQEKDGLTSLTNPYQAQRSEFLRSTDPLFRPVNFANGPDGALYLVDMYRGIIQEGNWVREGSYLRKVVQQYSFDQVAGRGRIWRLVHDDTKLGPAPRMNGESAAELVAHLEHPNGWWRDTAQKLLVLKGDPSVVPTLAALARTAPKPLTRLHALWTLDGLHAANAGLVREKLRDADPQVRAAAIRVGEGLVKDDAALQRELEAKITDPAPEVAMQTMLSAKREKWPSAAEFVKRLAASPAAGVRLTAEALRPAAKTENTATWSPEDKKLFASGKEVFQTLCAACHGADGKGMPMAGAAPDARLAPSLVDSKTVMGSPEGPTLVLLHGLIGDIDGKKYEGQMISMGTNDDAWIASVLSYARIGLAGREGAFVRPPEVAALRKAYAARTQPWTIPELRAVLPQPLNNRSAWKVTASHNPTAANKAIDGDAGTRWDSAHPQVPGMWFQVELPEQTAVTGVRIDSANSPGDFPRGYTVKVSNDGTTWSESLATGTGRGASTEIQFAPRPTKFLRITQTGTQPTLYWSIHELQLLSRPATP